MFQFTPSELQSRTDYQLSSLFNDVSKLVGTHNPPYHRSALRSLLTRILREQKRRLAPN